MSETSDRFDAQAQSDPTSMLRVAQGILSRIEFGEMESDDISEIRTAMAATAGQFQLLRGRFAMRVDALHRDGHCAPPQDEVGRGSGMSNDEAERITRHASLLAQFPRFAEALGEGRISDGHVEALARFFGTLDASDRAVLICDDGTLSQAAKNMCVEDFRRHLWKRKQQQERKAGKTPEQQSRARNRMTGGIDGFSNRYDWHINLDPIMGQRLENALNAEIERIKANGETGDLDPDLISTPSHLRAHALSNLISRGFQFGRPTPSSGAVTELGIIMDAKTFHDGEHDATICETTHGLPVSVAEARRIACEAGIYPVVLSGESLPLDVGRAVRLATPAQRKALRAIYRTCAISGCTAPFHQCEIHHLQYWEHHGPTDISNLAPVCGRHHHVIHEQEWYLRLDEDRTLHVRRPDGQWDTPQPLRPLSPSVDDTGPPGDSPPGEQLTLVA